MLYVVLQKFYCFILNVNLKIFASFAYIANFDLNAQSISVKLEHPNFYKSVYTPFYLLLKVLQKLLRKILFFIYILYVQQPSL